MDWFPAWVLPCAHCGAPTPIRLEKVGFEVGIRVLELLSYREKVLRRKTDVLDILRFIHGPAWQYLFGKTADDLQQAANVCWAGRKTLNREREGSEDSCLKMWPRPGHAHLVDTDLKNRI